MPRLEGCARVEELLAAHRSSDPPSGWWFQHDPGLVQLLDRAGDACRVAPKTTLDRVGGDPRPREPVSTDQLSNLDEHLTLIAFGLLVEECRLELRGTLAGECRHYFGWKVVEDDLDSALSDIFATWIQRAELIRELLTAPGRKKVFHRCARQAFSALKKFWHLDRKHKVTPLESEIAAPGGGVDSELRRRELWEQLEKSPRLNDEQKHLLRLQFEQCLTVREIAERTSKPVSTTSDRLAAATNLWRQLLRDTGSGPDEGTGPSPSPPPDGTRS